MERPELEAEFADSQLCYNCNSAWYPTSYSGAVANNGTFEGVTGAIDWFPIAARLLPLGTRGIRFPKPGSYLWFTATVARLCLAWRRGATPMPSKTLQSYAFFVSEVLDNDCVQLWQT